MDIDADQFLPDPQWGYLLAHSHGENLGFSRRSLSELRSQAQQAANSPNFPDQGQLRALPCQLTHGFSSYCEPISSRRFVVQQHPSEQLPQEQQRLQATYIHPYRTATRHQHHLCESSPAASSSSLPSPPPQIAWLLLHRIIWL